MIQTSNSAQPRDLVFCRVEHDVQDVHCVNFLLFEVLEVDEHGQVTHVCGIGKSDQYCPSGPYSIEGRFITRIEEHIPREADQDNGGLAYSAAILLAKDKVFYPSDEYLEVLSIIQALKWVKRPNQ